MQKPSFLNDDPASPRSSFLFKPDEDCDSSLFRSKAPILDDFLKDFSENPRNCGFFSEFRQEIDPEIDPNPAVFKEKARESRRIVKKKDVVGRTAKVNAYLRRKLAPLFGADASSKQKLQLVPLVFEALFVLQWPLEKCNDIFDWFYYDVDKNQLNSLEDVYEEISKEDVYFVEEYEKELPNLVLSSNLAKDFWEKEQKPLKNAKKVQKKRRARGRSAKKPAENDYIQQQINKLLREREEFYSTRGLFEEVSQKNQETDASFRHKTAAADEKTAKNYSLREKKRQKASNFDDSLEKIDKEEAQIFNRRFKKRYNELLQAKKLRKFEETQVSEKKLELNDKELRKKIEENLLQKLQTKKSKVSGCFLEDSPQREQKVAEIASPQKKSVKLSELGEKNARPLGKKLRNKRENAAKAEKPQAETAKTRTRGVKVKEIIDLEGSNPQCFEGLTNVKWEFNINFNEI